MYPSYENKDAFHSQLKSEFGAVFSTLSKKLRDGLVLEINVTDIDLAGEVQFDITATRSQVRVNGTTYWPRVNFTYQLKNPEGEIIASGSEILRGMDYLSQSRIPSGITSFVFEERMLKEWFKQQVIVGKFPTEGTNTVASIK